MQFSKTMKFYFSVSKVREILLFLFIFEFIFHVCSRFQSIYLHKIIRTDGMSHVKIIIMIFSLFLKGLVDFSKVYCAFKRFSRSTVTGRESALFQFGDRKMPPAVAMPTGSKLPESKPPTPASLSQT